MSTKPPLSIALKYSQTMAGCKQRPSGLTILLQELKMRQCLHVQITTKEWCDREEIRRSPALRDPAPTLDRKVMGYHSCARL